MQKCRGALKQVLNGSVIAVPGRLGRGAARSMNPSVVAHVERATGLLARAHHGGLAGSSGTGACAFGKVRNRAFGA